MKKRTLFSILFSTFALLLSGCVRNDEVTYEEFVLHRYSIFDDTVSLINKDNDTIKVMYSHSLFNESREDLYYMSLKNPIFYFYVIDGKLYK